MDKSSPKQTRFIDVQLRQLRISMLIAAVLLFFKLLAPVQAAEVKQWYAQLDAMCGPEAHMEAAEAILPGLAQKIEGVISQLKLFIDDEAKEAFSVKAVSSQNIKLSPGLTRPLETAAITYPYGFRNDPFTGDRSFHSGTDYAAPLGSPVYPAAEGRVEKVGYNDVYGNFVTIKHAINLYSVYGHLDSASVFSGQYVNTDTVIGKVGSTGRSTGYHLHLEVIKNGYRVDPETCFNDAL